MEKPKTFFDGDLDEAEADRLEASILADPGLAQSLTEEARLRYAATGLPDPAWDQRRGPRGLAWLMTGLATIALVAWFWQGDPAEVEAVARMEGPAWPVLTAQPVAAMPLEQAGAELAPALQPIGLPGQRLGVALRLEVASPAEVLVLAADGRVVRSLFSGTLDAGERRFEWDGLDAGLRPVPPGDYKIVARTNMGQVERPLRLSPGRR